MFCDRCGAQLAPGQNFCPNCGKSMSTVPLMPQKSRLAGHMRLLAILWLALSAFRLLPGIFLIVFFGHARDFLPPDVPGFVPSMLQGIGMMLLIGAGIGIAIAWGLLERQPWARMLAIIFGCFSLLDMPFGTALGVYTLWVLLPAKSEEEYRQMAKAA
ncbi:MAG: zinc ribbon domain-containing protein [Acidobacteriaceae bacterium]|nr:zinc ribbon domain-containing protein [Acidobacteriaceae bacterium]MBV9766979.1 zinc ribbon domain-containing protein [Acidobacteriaceae bacterium]